MLGIRICEDIVLFADRQNSITATTSKNANVTCSDARQMAWSIHWRMLANATSDGVHAASEAQLASEFICTFLTFKNWTKSRRIHA